MTWEEALEIVVSKTGVNKDHYINTCNESNLKYITNRQRLIDKAKALLIAEDNRPATPAETMPSLLEQAYNLAASMSEYAKSGFKNVSDEVYKERISICDGCDLLRKEDRRCYECGCFVDKKAYIAVEECPKKKWLAQLDVINDKPSCGVCNHG